MGKIHKQTILLFVMDTLSLFVMHIDIIYSTLLHKETGNLSNPPSV